MRMVPRMLYGSAVIAAAAALCACVSSVVVESEFPAPLIEPLPVRMGILYEEDLQNFIHVEALPQRSAWTIDLGDANMAMLSPLFQGMFSQTLEVETVPVEPSLRSTLDGVLRPRLQKFEFDVPIGERDEFVEVWMQYLLTLYEPDGSVVTEWPVSGYGKAELTGRSEDSVHRAAVIALREVGAAISTKFVEQPDVSYWLQERQDEAALSADLGS